MAAKPGATRMKSYKSKGLDLEELRRRKEEEGIELRKSKRDDQLSKRRNISLSDSSVEYGDSSMYLLDTPLELLARGVYSSDDKELISALRGIRVHLCVEHDPPIFRVIELRILPKLVELLCNKKQVSDILFEVCWIFTNICGGSSYHTRCVIEAGAVLPLIGVMKSPCTSLVQEQAVWALSNIAGDSSECRDILLGVGVMDPLLLLLIDDHISLPLKRNCVWLLSNLCRGKNPPPNEHLVFSSLHVLATALYCDDVNVLSDACWALAYLSEGSDKRIERVVNGGVVKRLVELMMHPDSTVVIPALRAIGNILTGADPLTQVVINCSVLTVLKKLLLSPIDQIKKESCWALSNITAGNKVQIQSVVDSAVMPLVLEIMDNETFKIRKEAAWIVLNAVVGGTNEQIVHLVDIGVVRPLCDLLTVKDSRILLVSLEGLECVMKAGIASSKDYTTLVEEANGMERLELLMDHPKPEICLLAQKLLDKYMIADLADSTTSTEHCLTIDSYCSQDDEI